MFKYRPNHITNLIELAQEDEHMINCLYHLLSAKEDSKLMGFQESLLFQIIKRVTNSYYNVRSVKILFERILNDREQYLRYFYKNKQLLTSLFEMILSKLPLNSDENKDNKQETNKHYCNFPILEILIKLSQNIIVDIQKSLESNNVFEKKKNEVISNLKLKQKAVDDPKITTSKNWHMTINNEITVNINGIIIKKPREVIIAPCDYEREMESDDEESDEEEAKLTNNINSNNKVENSNMKEQVQIDNIYDQKLIIDYLTRFMNIIIINLNSLSLMNNKLLGLENLVKIEFFNNYLEILIDLNFLHYIMETKKRMLTGNLDSSNKFEEMNSRFTTNLGKDSIHKQSFDFSQLIDHLTFSSTDIPNDSLKDFIRNIFNCF
ncbi:MAG: hypothetical protein ACK5YA_00225, partial [bacterium]